MKCDFETTPLPGGLFHHKCRVCEREKTNKGDFYMTTCRPRGLGDVVAMATNAIGIETCAGCEKRKRRLNRLVPYKSE